MPITAEELQTTFRVLKEVQGYISWLIPPLPVLGRTGIVDRDRSVAP